MTSYGGLDVGRFTDRSIYIEYDADSHSLVNSIELRPGTFRQQADVIRKYITVPTLVDCTGIGQGFYEILVEYGLPVRRMVLVSGDQYLWKPIGEDELMLGKADMSSISVCKSRLVYGISAAMGGLNSRLTPEANASMAAQMRQFIVKTGKYNRFEAAVGHDDYVIAFGAALIEAQIHGRHIKGQPRPREVQPTRPENHYKGRTLIGESFISGNREPQYDDRELGYVSDDGTAVKRRNWRGFRSSRATGPRTAG